MLAQAVFDCGMALANMIPQFQVEKPIYKHLCKAAAERVIKR